MTSGLGITGEIDLIGEEDFLTVQWRIQYALTFKEENFCVSRSPLFSASNENWTLWLHPNRKNESGCPSSDLLGIILYRWRGSPRKTFHISVGIKGPRGLEKVKEVERDFPGEDGNNHHRWDHFCLRSDLVKHRKRLMPGGILTITCIMKRLHAATGVDVLQRSEQNVLKSGKITHVTLKEQGSSGNSEGNHDNNKDGRNDKADDSEKASRIKDNVKQEDQVKNAKKRLETLVKDLDKLFSSSEGSDVTVQVGDAEFKAHRIILSARSPVLSAMFKHETEEKATNKVTICDFEPQVFKEYLKYIYTGSVEHLSEQNVFQLYRIADKYLAEELKEQCLMHIRSTLSVQTFCDTVKLALMHGESGLLQQAIDFATENIRSIIYTVEWQNFIREHPTEANEVLIKSLGPECPCKKIKVMKN